MTYIEAKKAEVQRKLENSLYISQDSNNCVLVNRDKLERLFAETVDTLLDEIESRVLEHMPYEAPDQPNQDAVKAFQHLRTGGDITS